MIKDLDFKLRERFEQKEYYPDKYGETRVDRMKNKKLIKQAEEEKTNDSSERIQALQKELQAIENKIDSKISEKEKAMYEKLVLLSEQKRSDNNAE